MLEAASGCLHPAGTGLQNGGRFSHRRVDRFSMFATEDDVPQLAPLAPGRRRTP
jgi:hypothetical protein